MIYKYNEPVPVKALADLRQAVGWNRMEKEYASPLGFSASVLTAWTTWRSISAGIWTGPERS